MSMKTLLPFFLFLTLTTTAQITTPIIKAGFGVDADLRANYFNGFVQSGNDDWYLKDAGTGQYVIDTTGAYQLVQAYNSDASPWPVRMSSIYRTMRKDKPPYSIVNNRLWLDALFVRDYHGTDTTAFTLASKNGDSPGNWTSDIQNIPDKNDILDMFMHIRRAGPNTTDSLWFFGGLSLDNVTGNRYFDFEMYQTDIYYDRATKSWYGYGPDAGHTSWQFDAAGNVTRPGDIIFSASYQSSGLTSIEARIWIDRASLSITPAEFDWSGLFDGASSSSQFGYASILPKNGGTFYTGLQSKNGEWTGPFQVVLQNNTLSTTYQAYQFMEFSVNLTKLGLDPVTTFGSDVCGTPFNRLVVKTRASASFTAALKDFVAPTDLFLSPRVQALADVPVFCGTMGVSNLSVQNPSSSSYYTWSTTDGHISGSSTGTSISVDSPGTYIVTQRLSAYCNPYATDTVAVAYDGSCTILANSLTMFKGNVTDKIAQLKWTTNSNNTTDYFEVQRSFDGKVFTAIQTIKIKPTDDGIGNYAFQEDISAFNKPYVYYRLKIKMQGGVGGYSNVLRLNFPINSNDAMIFPNPANDVIQLAMTSDKKQDVKMQVYNFAGALVESKSYPLIQGTNVFSINIENWKQGAYVVELLTANQTIHKKLIVQRQMQVR